MGLQEKLEGIGWGIYSEFPNCHLRIGFWGTVHGFALIPSLHSCCVYGKIQEGDAIFFNRELQTQKYFPILNIAWINVWNDIRSNVV